MEDLTGLGKMSDAIEKGTKELRQLTYDFLAPPVKEAGQFIAEKVRYFRFTNAIKTMQKAKEKLTASGLNTNPVNLKTLLPLLEGASLEEDEAMVDKWAGLLASASSSKDSFVSFVHILREIGTNDAKILDIVGLHSVPAMYINDIQYFGISIPELSQKSGLEIDSLFVVLGNLVRLGLVQRIYKDPGMTWGAVPLGTGKDDMAGLTPLGFAFLVVCYGPSYNDNINGPKRKNR